MSLIDKIKKLNKKQKYILSIIVALVLILIIWGILFSFNKTKAEITVVISKAPSGYDFCDTAHTSSVYSENFHSLIHDDLLKKPKDNENEPENQLVSEFNFDSNDPKKINATLKENIFFHNNEKVTVDDIIFTYQRFVNKNNKNITQNIENIQKINDKEFIINLKNNTLWKKFIFYKFFKVFNKKAIQKNEEQGLLIGTGPYKFIKKNTSNTEYKLEKFNNYHNKDIIKNLPQTIDIKVIQNDDTALQELEKENVDIILNYPSHKTHNITNKTININEFDIAACSYLYFNKKNTTSRTRQAITKAIDIKKIISDLKSSNTPAYGGVLHPSLIGFNPNIKNLEKFNKEEGTQLVKTLSDKERNIQILTSNPDTTMLEKISTHLREVGFQVNITFISGFEEMMKKFINGEGNILTLGESHELSYNYKYFEDYFDPNITKENNFCQIDEDGPDKENIHDKLVKTKQSTTKKDFEKLIQEIELYISQENYVLPLTYNKQFTLTNKKINKINIGPFGNFDVSQLTINKEKN